MSNIKEISQNLFWVGANDKRLALFENIYPLPNGVSYNSYVLMDEKTALLDTVDASVADVFFDNLQTVLQGRPLDYVVVQHMEPDHSATLRCLIKKYPEITVVCNAKTQNMIHQFFGADLAFKTLLVQEGDTLSLGKHTFTFVMAPMVHWPEVMMTYEQTEKVLFSADAFGTFGTLDGAIFADEVNFEKDYLAEARRYYANIVGKYGMPVQTVLKKAAGLDIQMICPLHGFVWRKNLGYFMDKYQHWSTYQPEETAAIVAYASIYGNTAKAAEKMASALVEKGMPVKVYDLSKTGTDVVLGEVFRASHLVLASATHDGGIFEPMDYLLHAMLAHNVQGRKVLLMENGSWAPMAGKQMKTLVEAMKEMTIMEQIITIKSALTPEQEKTFAELAADFVK